MLTFSTAGNIPYTIRKRNNLPNLTYSRLILKVCFFHPINAAVRKLIILEVSKH
jgi:hypothetical protein